MSNIKFKFKTQKYQTDAVDAICNVFNGQPYSKNAQYTRDLGIIEPKKEKWDIFNFDENAKEASKEFLKEDEEDIDDTGFANERLMLTSEQLLTNIKDIQNTNNIKESSTLSHKIGAVELDVEMETGTGKTYVYIRTMFELNKRYGFSKFIVVVPSIAIREGVFKTFSQTEDHFMDIYGKKARFFIYNSKNLNQLDSFSSSDAINVMIINIQAFNARGADARKIYEEQDSFQSRKPIDVIKKNRPILILDEPQKMSGSATQESLLNFNPLFSLNFSATHKIQHNLVYVLDALDAYNKKLVKKIEVKGFQIKNLRGTNGYLYLQDIILSPNKPPMAKIEFEILYSGARINRETRNLSIGDNLYQISNNMEQYKDGYVISEVNPFNNTVTFLNGEVLELGTATGDVNENDVRRIQIRETIKSHFEKEEELFNKGIKVLSLFFIDEVAKYRQYDEDGNEVNGEYGKIFEEEYNNIVNEYITVFNTPYCDYLRNTSASKAHNGYFSIDKKGRKIDSKTTRGTDTSDDESAYDLILKDKERLLSFEEPTRFIFSHSALREGWDNPNVFQICTLKHSSNDVQRRQEVGRGLRICVNKFGDRMDSTIEGIDFYDINKLTVIANESYESFVKGIQSEIKTDLYDRPTKASVTFFTGKTIIVNNKEEKITSRQATAIYQYLLRNNYIDLDEKPTEDYKQAKEAGTLAPMIPELEPIAEQIHTLIQSIYDDKVIGNMINNGRQSKVQDNNLNENFNKKEFQKLWNLINHKYAYYVDFDSNELINNSVKVINSELYVTELKYTITIGEQKENIDKNQIENSEAFKEGKISTKTLKTSTSNQIKYDLLGKITQQTSLTRKTIATILKNIDDSKFILFSANPEEFINKVSKMINEQKASLIVEHITYNQVEGQFDSIIFTESKLATEYANAYKAKKHIRDYVFVDGINKSTSIERVLAEDMDKADEVVVYAKLPTSFYIPTPVGNYSPDWAIAFKEGSVKHIYFVAETKGTLDSLQLRGVEKAKIECAKKLFNNISTSQVRYEHINTYQSLLDKMNALK